MGRYITVNISTSGLYQVGSRSWGTVGVIGRGVGSNFTVGTAYVIISPTEAKELFGETSALFQSIVLLFQNGATSVIAIPTGVEAQTPETFNGTGSQTEFTLSDIPAQPLDVVTVSSVEKIEGVDFYVDYGNKKIIFYTAPATGTGNVSITYSQHTTVTVGAALTVMEEQDVQILVGAMMFDSSLISLIKTHCVTMLNSSARIAVYMLPKAVTDVALATTLASELSILVAHKSLKDASAGLAGLISSLRPWKDLTMKEVKGLEQSGKFTSTQIAAFDAAKIITMFDPPKLTGNGVVCSTGWTLDTSGTLQFIDQVRVAHHIASVLEYGLTNPNIIGEIRINRTGMRELDAFIRSLLVPWVNAGELDGYEIDSPARTLFELDTPNTDQVNAIIALQASRRIKDAYAITIKLIYSGTVIYIEINAALTGGVAA